MQKSREAGPFSQVITGLDIALWDLIARREHTSVRVLLNSNAPNRVPVFASGIHVTAAEEMINSAREAGFVNFKVKIDPNWGSPTVSEGFFGSIDGLPSKSEKVQSEKL